MVFEHHKQVISLTFDTEWLGRAHLLEGIVPHHRGLERDVEATHRILDVLSELSIHGTFFCVSEDVDKNLARRIVEEGHEVASHSCTHPILYQILQNDLVKELKNSKDSLEQKSGKEVLGFRAPSWSVSYDMQERFFNALLEARYQYDSSLSSFKSGLFGDKRFPKDPFRHTSGIVEIPLPSFGFPRAPWIGGFFFRMIPNFLLEEWVKDNKPAFLYFHPWEFYEASIKLDKWFSNFVTNANRKNNFKKFVSLLKELTKQVHFSTMKDLLPDLLQQVK